MRKEKRILGGQSVGNLILLICIAVALIISFYVAGQRQKIESASKTATVLLEWNQLIDLAAKSGSTVEDVLAQVAPSIQGVLFKEPNLAEFNNQRLTFQMTGDELNRQVRRGEWLWEGGAAQKIDASWNVILCQDDAILAQVKEQLEVKTGIPCQELPLTYLDGTPALMLATTYPATDLATIGLGFLPENLQMVEDAGLSIVVQIRNFFHVTEDAVNTVFAGLSDYPVIAVGFNDDELPGAGLPAAQWSEACNLWADKLDEANLPLMTAEFFKQKGIESLAAKVDYNVLRMHSIQEKERATMSIDQVAQRFQLAASERNMRLLFVRFGPNLSLESNMEYVTSIETALLNKGIDLGVAQPMAPLAPAPLLLLLISLGVAAGGIFLCRALGLGKVRWLLGILAFLLVAALLFTGRVSNAISIISFAAVVIFPTLAICTNVKNEPTPHLGKAIGTLVLTCLCSLIGAALMVGAMGSRGYMVAVTIFSGVKLAHVLPLLLLLFFFWFRRRSQDNLAVTLQKTWDMPVKVGYILILGVLVIALGVYVMRTGNDGVSVSGLERSFRALLDQLLVVRPRTKEFLIGHPIFLLLIYYGYKKGGLPLLLIGAIGQISLVNTFAHAHTPLWVSLLRTFNGLVIGIIIGVILILLVRWLVKWWQKKLAAGGMVHD